MITASCTGSPRYSSATRFISRRMIDAISVQVNALPLDLDARVVVLAAHDR